MAVDLFVSGLKDDEPRVRFDDDAYYWFMWPLFEALAKRTGQLVDLYGKATFREDSLAALRDTVSEARRLVSAKPDSWQVVVGWMDMSRKQERYATAQRADFIRLLDDLDRLIAQAEQLRSPIVCLGD